MQSVIFTVSVLIFSSIFLGEGDCAATSSDLPPIALDIERINNLVPLEKKRKTIFEFLMDPKNLSDLEALTKQNIPGTKAVLAEVFNLLVPGHDSCVYKLRGALNHDIVELRNLDLKMADLKKYLIEYFTWIVEIEKRVGHIANFLEAYKKVDEKDEKFKNLHFSKFISIGDFAKLLSEALLKLLPEKWEEKVGKDSFYGRLNEAIDKDDKAAVSKDKIAGVENKPADDKNKPTDDKNKPTDDKNKPTEDEKKPTEDENKSTEDEKKSGAAASADLSQIPTFVDLINDLIPVEKKRDNIFKFLSNPKNLFGLEAAVRRDNSRTKAVLAEVIKLLTPGCLYEIEDAEHLKNVDSLHNLGKAIDDLLLYSGPLNMDDFKLQEFFIRIAKFLGAYSVVADNEDLMGNYFKNWCSIGDFAEPLSNALIYLVPDDPLPGSFYDKLFRAIRDDDEDAVNKGKAADDEHLSPIAAEVNRINDLILPNDMRRENTVTFLMDLKNWTDLFENAATLDLVRINAVMNDANKLLTSGCEIKNPEDWNNIKELFDLHIAIKTLPESCTAKNVEEFVLTYVIHIADFMDAYSDVEKKGEDFINLHFNKFDPIGDFAEPLSKVLKKLVPDVPEEGSVFERLTNAIKDDDDKAALKKNKSGDNGGGDAPASGNLGKYFLIGTCIALPLIIIGVVIIFMLRKK